MRIAIDIDGTINQAHYYDILHGREFMEENNIFHGFDGTKQYPKDMYHMDQETYVAYMDKWFPWNVRECPLALNARETITDLHNDFTIIIMTARDEYREEGAYTGQMMKRDTIEYFIKNGIPYDEIYFSCKDKYEACKKYNCDLLIDDSPKHIQECADNGIPVIIASHFYNSQYQGYPNTIVGNNWIDIKKKIYSLL